MAGHGELSELQAELMRQFQKLPELLERLRREHPMVEQGLENLARHWFSGAAPGTEHSNRTTLLGRASATMFNWHWSSSRQPDLAS